MSGRGPVIFARDVRGEATSVAPSSVSGVRPISNVEALAPIRRTAGSRKRMLLVGADEAPEYAEELAKVFDLTTASGMLGGLTALLAEPFHIAACRARLDDGSAADWLRQAKHLSVRNRPAIVVFDAEDAHEAVRAIELGVRQLLPACTPQQLARKLARLMLVPAAV